MTLTQAQQWYARLTESQKIRFLAGLAHELTMSGRDTYVAGGEGLNHPEDLRAINEVIHRVTAAVMAKLDHDSRQYPDEVLIGICFAPDDPDSRLVNSAFDAAVRYMEQSPALTRH